MSDQVWQDGLRRDPPAQHLSQRGHSLVGDTAGHDVVEPAQVDVAVESQAVAGDQVFAMHAHRTHLLLLLVGGDARPERDVPRMVFFPHVDGSLDRGLGGFIVAVETRSRLVGFEGAHPVPVLDQRNFSQSPLRPSHLLLERLHEKERRFPMELAKSRLFRRGNTIRKASFSPLDDFLVDHRPERLLGLSHTARGGLHKLAFGREEQRSVKVVMPLALKPMPG